MHKIAVLTSLLLLTGCTTGSFTAFTSNQGAIELPASGRFVLESHLATTSDTFSDGRLFPKSTTENIQAHLNNSYRELRKIQAGIDSSSVYTTRYHKEWTPPENGKAGQGCVGNTKPSIREEMFSGNMMWMAGKKPVPGTKFLASYKGRHVVFVMGYECGPRNPKWLGGLQGEVFYFLGASEKSIITITKCKDQSLLPGPVASQ
jgi:hypothetical protein